ncbi:hypothetical protein N7450_006926 [Penicillium hetheringtonii]|uniref:Uncharacterized protein n=1 Tax=Penicillium hetheringtonii TaxID=911720 RepID=A0AAD6DI34_9EURO|nr:hypothetical protein N7450_006926 [Penicillium hetheringtonii]
MTRPVKISTLRQLAPTTLRSRVIPSSSSPIASIPRRCYSVEAKAKEVQPGGQRQLLIGSCLAMAGLGAFWLSRGKGDVNENARGANQEYEKSAEGNK